MTSTQLFSPVPAGALPGLFARTAQADAREQIIVGRRNDVVAHRPGERVRVASFLDAFIGSHRQIWIARLPVGAIPLHVPVLANFNDDLGQILLPTCVTFSNAASFARWRMRTNDANEHPPRPFSATELRSAIADHLEPLIDNVAHRIAFADVRHTEVQHALRKAIQVGLATFDPLTGLQLAYMGDGDELIVAPPEAQLARNMRIEVLRKESQSEQEAMEELVAAANTRRRRRQILQLVKKLDAPQPIKPPTIAAAAPRATVNWSGIIEVAKFIVAVATMTLTLYFGIKQINVLIQPSENQILYARELMGSLAGLLAGIPAIQGLQNIVYKNSLARNLLAEDDEIWPLAQRAELDRRVRNQISSQLEQIAQSLCDARRTSRQRGNFEDAAALRPIPDAARALRTELETGLTGEAAYLKLFDGEDGTFRRMITTETDVVYIAENALKLATEIAQADPAMNIKDLGAEMANEIRNLQAALKQRSYYYQTLY